MKVLHILSSLHTGGAEKLAVDLTPRFSQDGIEVDVLVLNGTDTPFKQKLRQAGIRVFELSKNGPVYNPLYIFKLIPYLKRYDIVHTHTTGPQLFAAIGSVLCSVVLVTTEHNTSNRRRGWRWYAPIDRWMYGRYRRIICISDKTESRLRNHLRKDTPNICTIYNGVDTQAFFAAKPDASLSNDFKGCLRLMMVARFAAAKDQETVIRAVSLLPSEYHVFFVGDGVNRSGCELLAKELRVDNRVHFLGVRSDVPQLLKSIDIVVQSSHWDGFGLVAVEGMAARKPVIASDVDGLREVVAGAGLLFVPGSAQDLADKIRSLAENPELYEQTAERCFARSKAYDISAMVKGYETVYNQLMDNLTTVLD